MYNIKTKIFMINFMVIYTFSLIAPLYSDSLSVDQKKLNVISLNIRMNPVVSESEDNEFNIGLMYARQIGSFKVGFALERNTFVSGLWMGLDLRYQKYNSRWGFGIYYAKWLVEEDTKPYSIYPFIIYMSIALIPTLERRTGINFEIRPGFDFDCLRHSDKTEDIIYIPEFILVSTTISIIIKP